MPTYSYPPLPIPIHTPNPFLSTQTHSKPSHIHAFPSYPIPTHTQPFYLCLPIPTPPTLPIPSPPIPLHFHPYPFIPIPNHSTYTYLLLPNPIPIPIYIPTHPCTIPSHLHRIHSRPPSPSFQPALPSAAPPLEDRFLGAREAWESA